MNDEARRPMNIAEIQQEVELVARTGEGADKFRALKLLHSMRQTEAAVPPPLSDRQMVEHAARLLKAMGRPLANLALSEAFRGAHHRLPAGIALDENTAPEFLVKQARTVTSIPLFYKMFPDLKHRGGLKGFPYHTSIMTRVTWLQREALRILVEREAADLDTDLKVGDQTPAELPPEDES